MSATATTTSTGPRDAVRSTQPVELARYTTPTDGERVLQGIRVHNRAMVIDVPADPDGPGRVYLVERDVHVDGNRALQALLVDYLGEVERQARIPMAGGVLERYLQHLNS